MEPNQKKANGLALIPFAVFVGVYLATGITLNAMGVEMAFYQLPTPIASFIGIIVAFAMFKGKFDDKLSVFLHGCGEENIMIMSSCLPEHLHLFLPQWAVLTPL